MAVIRGRGFDFLPRHDFSNTSFVWPIFIRVRNRSATFDVIFESEESAPMNESKIAEYRAQAAACIALANLNANKSTSGRWLKVAEEWTRLADALERRNEPMN